MNSIVLQLPQWNYDGSSTNQASTEKSEVILKPVKAVKDPFRNGKNENNLLVLCETFDSDGNPLKTNTRNLAKQVFDMETEHKEPMFGLEQEFFISRKVGNLLLPISFQTTPSVPEPQAEYYCGVGGSNVFGRQLVEEMLEKLNYADIPITGLNAEGPGRWEFQVCSTELMQVMFNLVKVYLQLILEKHMLYTDITAIASG